ncbi:sulfotransferase domain-containing protein, partial [Thermodesulfobacteriota bacterium]
NLYFHIGYPRTGTTFLQKYIFPQYSDEAIVDLDLTWFFVNENKNNKQKLFSYIDDYFKGRKYEDKPIINSWENLSGDVLRDFQDVPCRIYDMFPESKILICLRSQFTMIPSLYHIYVKEGGNFPYRKYIDALLENDKLNYYNIVKDYINYFGRDSVYVMFYEEMKRNTELFLKGLINFIGLPEKWDLSVEKKYRNTRNSLISIELYRNFNIIKSSYFGGGTVGKAGSAAKICEKLSRDIFSIIISIFNKGSIITGLDRKMSMEKKSKYRKRIKSHYSSSNRQLMKVINFDAIELGYPM